MPTEQTKQNGTKSRKRGKRSGPTLNQPRSVITQVYGQVWGSSKVTESGIIVFENTQDPETVNVVRSADPLCNVHVSKSMKFNLGNYESAEVRVGVSLPCRIEDMELAARFADTFINERIQRESASCREWKSARTNG